MALGSLIAAVTAAAAVTMTSAGRLSARRASTVLGPAPAAPGQEGAAGGLPRPTPQQLAWHRGEIMALVHFNMATMFR
jgi:hypothetical protein